MSTWEDRMAAAAAKRRADIERAAEDAREADRARVRELLPDGTDWLHDWPLIGDAAVLMGTGVHCAGCGRLLGVTCVAFDEDWQPPPMEPDWRFEAETCPICPRERCDYCGRLLGGGASVFGSGHQYHFGCAPGAQTMGEDGIWRDRDGLPSAG